MIIITFSQVRPSSNGHSVTAVSVAPTLSTASESVSVVLRIKVLTCTYLFLPELTGFSSVLNSWPHFHITK